MVSTVTIGKRVPKTPENNIGYEIVETIPADEVCVITIGGDGVDTDKKANGYAKIVKNEVLNDIEGNVSVYGITYNWDKDDKRSIARNMEFVKHRSEILINPDKVGLWRSKAGPEELNPQYVDDLYKKIIEPRISNLNGKVKLPLEEAQKRIRKLNIVAHCHGAYVALKLEKKMQQTMEKLGYRSEERKQIQSQLMIIAQAPGCPLGVSNSQFISFKTVYDQDAPHAHNWFNHYIDKRKHEEMLRYGAEENKNEEKIKANRWFDFKPCYFAPRQGNLFMIKQRYEWIDGEGPFMVNRDEHNKVNFNYAEKNMTNHGRMLMYFSRTILQNGIKNSLEQEQGFRPLPPIEELVLSDNPQMNEKASHAFAKMKENGKEFRAEVFNYTMNTLKPIREAEANGEI